MNTMKNKLRSIFKYVAISSFAMSSCLPASAQSSIVLDQNNVSAPLSDDGTFFTDLGSSSAGYEVPKGGGVSAIYQLGFLYGGVDVNGQLKMAIGPSGGDLFPGPATIGAATGATPGQWPSSFAAVSRDEIELHIQNYNQAGYVIPPSILNWPAHGDVSNGFDYYLAPFVDIDQDGNYDPSNGDYPCIKGDKAVYIVMNDKSNVHSSGSEPIGMEVHYMFYQYEGLGDLDNTTFLETKMINRGTQTLFDFKSSAFLDIDLGNPFDDYVGTDSSRNLVYGYNADAFDETSLGSSGYGIPVPAIGIMTLDRALESGGKVESTPSTVVQYYNLMNATSISGVPWPTNYLYHGNPYLVTGETEYEMGNPPGDRRAIATVDHATLVPNAEHVTTYAILYAEGTDHLESVNQLYIVADVIQNFFDTLSTTCVGATAGLNESTDLQALVYPNPSKGSFVVKFDHTVLNGSLSVHDLSGRIIHHEVVNGNEVQLNIVESSGVYFLLFEESGRFGMQKLVIE